MSNESTGPHGAGGPIHAPSFQALEAAATIRFAKLIVGQVVQPSRRAVEIAAKLIANKALRELGEKQARPDHTPLDP